MSLKETASQTLRRSLSGFFMKGKCANLILFALLVFSSVAPGIFAQRKAVSGAEVTGTFRSYFTGKYRRSYNEILIQALGKNRIRIEMELMYPFEVNGERMVHTGMATGEAVITGNTAVFVPDDAVEADERCKITLRFTKPGTLVVSTENNSGCGFGFNVEADGTYRKTRAAKPSFRNERR